MASSAPKKAPSETSTERDAGTGDYTTLKGIVASLVTASLVFAHARFPTRWILDWPTVALAGLAIVLFFTPEIIAVAPYIRKLKWGDKELEIERSVVELRRDVIEVEDEGLPASASRRTPAEQSIIRDIQSQVLDLASKDKRAALLRLAIEIEEEMVKLHTARGLTYRKPSWRELATNLRNANVFSDPVFRAILAFRDVRNNVIHSGFGGLIDDNTLTQAIDNGLTLLRTITSLRGTSS